MSGGAVLQHDLAPLQPLLGAWAGEGQGDYPTIAPFAYTEEITFGALRRSVAGVGGWL